MWTGAEWGSRNHNWKLLISCFTVKLTRHLELKDGIAPSSAEYETAVLLLNYSSIWSLYCEYLPHCGSYKLFYVISSSELPEWWSALGVSHPAKKHLIYVLRSWPITRLSRVVPPVGFEPTEFSFWVRHVCQFHHGGIVIWSWKRDSNPYSHTGSGF